MIQSVTLLEARKQEDAREEAEGLWRILRYSASLGRPKSWGGFESEALHYVALLGIIVSEYSCIAGVEQTTT